MAMRSRAVLPAVAALALALVFATRLAFVSPHAAAQEVQSPQTALRGAEAPVATLGASSAGLFLASAPQPAHALLLQDEILPISFAVIGATLWGIVLGFVLLRLQEAFPE
eukprot:TRINITY_DN909_c0_g3_i1.p2 TRINITY_DN909_c0_g3~~TRINITY_DN909_c0_g3_i1.p2  ORF type:complete len:110 (+),score=34.18 TRINITY_DN909_c0_g3_i1:79-408(+)